MSSHQAGVGPHPQPWPQGDQYDEVLLKAGDSRNVPDLYRYWTVEAIKSDLDHHRQPLEIAIENVDRDFNMGTIVRAANAFNVAKVHIIGRRQWNKRGAMATDLYMHVEYHQTVQDFALAMRARQLSMIAIDIVDGAQSLASVSLPKQSVLVFGSEREGLSHELLQAADLTVCIEQLGSTRSLNVGVAAGIAMYVWVQQHALTR